MTRSADKVTAVLVCGTCGDSIERVTSDFTEYGLVATYEHRYSEPRNHVAAPKRSSK